MKDLVIKSISELLFENKPVVLEGLGIFETRAKKANIDQVQGLVHPPGREINFREDKNLQDSRLKEYLVEEKGMTEETAESTIRSFVGETISQMNKKEIVSLPDLGRLYIDFEKNIQFLPESTNFSKESFGLPTLNYFPVLRNKEQAIAETAATVSTPIPPSPVSRKASSSTNNGLLSKIFPWLLGFALIMVLGIFYWYWQSNRPGTAMNEGDKLSQMDGRVNTSPSKQRPTIDSTASETVDPGTNAEALEEESDSTPEEIPDEPQKQVEKSKPVPEKQVEKAPQVPPGSKECVIIVGGFASKENARRMIQDVTKAGYQAYSDTKGGLSRVGVSFAYKNEKEIEEKLQELKARFNNSSWVLKY